MKNLFACFFISKKSLKILQSMVCWVIDYEVKMSLFFVSVWNCVGTRISVPNGLMHQYNDYEVSNLKYIFTFACWTCKNFSFSKRAKNLNQKGPLKNTLFFWSPSRSLKLGHESVPPRTDIPERFNLCWINFGSFLGCYT